MRTRRDKTRMIHKNEHFSEGQMMLLQPYIELFTDFLLRNYKEEIETSQELRMITDLSMPEWWFPDTRQMRRKIVYHMGPTNSGKTRNAMIALEKAKFGLYLAPLRLLSWEIAELLQSRGLVCNLLTG